MEVSLPEYPRHTADPHGVWPYQPERTIKQRTTEKIWQSLLYRLDTPHPSIGLTVTREQDKTDPIEGLSRNNALVPSNLMSL